MTPRAARARAGAPARAARGRAAHTVPGLVHDARDVVVAQAPGTHAGSQPTASHLELRRSGAQVDRGARSAGRARAQARRARALGARGRADPHRALDPDRCAGSARSRLGERRPRGRAALPLPGDARRGAAPLARAATRRRPPRRDRGRGRARGPATRSRGRSVRRRRRGAGRRRPDARAAAAAPRRLPARSARWRSQPSSLPYGESEAVSERSWGALVAAVVALVGLAAALQPAPGRRPRAGRARGGRGPARAAARRPARACSGTA